MHIMRGNILYQFPSLRRIASRKMRICPEFVGRADNFFKDKWQFRKTSIAKRAMVVGLGGLKVFGVLILRGLLKDPIVAQVGFIKFITSINPLLQGKYPVSYTCGALCLRIANTTQ